MHFLVLESREGSGYADTPRGYVFPERYVRFFAPLERGEHMAALVYEPRREGGRQAFVGWVLLDSPPVRTTQRGLWEVQYQRPLISFDRPVPHNLGGVPVEHRLRGVPRHRWGAESQGKAVRECPAENFEEILRLGTTGDVRDSVYRPDPDILAGASLSGPIDAEDRATRLVRVAERAAGFRDAILEVYGFRCAISGLTPGPMPASRLAGIVEAAHVRAVQDGGPDTLDNGMVLTPTLHRMYDAGLFTLEARDDRLVVRTSPRLTPGMIRDEARGTILPLRDGAPFTLPGNRAAWPSREAIDHHRRHRFEARA